MTNSMLWIIVSMATASQYNVIFTQQPNMMMLEHYKSSFLN
uniref:Bm13007 n=1 Tax=Brugia malayi TaxID=6279 RepID=A0A1I9FZI1_BRUMA|nr:Bm13007 [Brugia malayi]